MSTNRNIVLGLALALGGCGDTDRLDQYYFQASGYKPFGRQGGTDRLRSLRRNVTGACLETHHECRVVTGEDQQFHGWTQRNDCPAVHRDSNSNTGNTPVVGFERVITYTDGRVPPFSERYLLVRFRHLEPCPH